MRAGIRALVGGRKQLVELRLELENHIRGTLKTFGIKLGTVTAVAFSAKVKTAISEKDALVQETFSPSSKPVMGSWHRTKHSIGDAEPLPEKIPCPNV